MKVVGVNDNEIECETEVANWVWRYSALLINNFWYRNVLFK